MPQPQRKPSSAPGSIEGSGSSGSDAKKEIYTYQAPWDIFSLAWSSSKSGPSEREVSGSDTKDDGGENDGDGNSVGGGGSSPPSPMKLAVGSFMEEYVGLSERSDVCYFSSLRSSWRSDYRCLPPSAPHRSLSLLLSLLYI